MTIGFTYPNYYMSEDYNSPQSPYWALKSFLALGLAEDHPFWKAEEKSLPQAKSMSVVPVQPPMHILCNTQNHHFLLSTGQFCPWPLKATEAKYGKFAYSSHFGFSVPTGTLIQQIAPDSTLALSKDDGDTWRVPWKVADAHFGSAAVRHKGNMSEIVHTLESVWKPWKDANVEVKTTLIAPTKRWPDWYLRVHTIKNAGSHAGTIRAVQGGFAIYGRRSAGEGLPNSNEAVAASKDKSYPESVCQTTEGALICSSAGASGIRTLPGSLEGSDLVLPTSQGAILQPDANTNLIWQRTLIPTIESQLETSKSTILMSAVFAVSRTSDRMEQYDTLNIQQRWEDVPFFSLSEVDSGNKEHYITII